MFEGVYNNSRMLHFLTAVVGSTCAVRVRSGSTFEGIFRTLSSKFELALEAVHRGGGAGPRREDIVDTMVFGAGDVVLATFRDVDVGAAPGDKVAEVLGSRRNGERRAAELQRWDGDDGDDGCELEADASNGWDPAEMFRFNEENYGVRTTYDSSLAAYTVALCREDSEAFRQREARAAQLAREIEGSAQYRLRVAIENDDGRDDERPLAARVALCREDPDAFRQREMEGGAPYRHHAAIENNDGRDDERPLAARDPKAAALPQRLRGAPGGLRCPPPPRPSPTPGGPQPPTHNAGPSRMSPKSQRPFRGGKAGAPPPPTPTGHAPSAPSHAPSGPGPAPPGSGSAPEDPPTESGRGGAEPPGKGVLPPEQRCQLDELRHFGAQFKLHAAPPPSPDRSPSPPPPLLPPPSPTLTSDKAQTHPDPNDPKSPAPNPTPPSPPSPDPKDDDGAVSK